MRTSLLRVRPGATGRDFRRTGVVELTSVAWFLLFALAVGAAAGFFLGLCACGVISIGISIGTPIRMRTAA